ncbi:type IV conjugative transfer system coupling protein TraD [Halorhodospira halophila]|uniref:type IV conjugative transfer system coupling protein TraD n=1 Tax=Halorhodospira halophila TaxID=1053 RepID=UPI001912B82F|nr:type IV conjugative transfer system coupling protein TraD [Halorhodospira halophila]MBK5944729.1 conjugative coupling factor TraD, PFGI-1 class [Halorhodospira halophila]
MSGQHPVEALLRPPVELYSAATAGMAAAIAAYAPWALMMNRELAWGTAVVFGAVAIARGYQGWWILRYQRNLRTLPEFRMTSRQIPVACHWLYLGRGFRWTQKHTQRLWDTIKPEAQRYIEPGPVYEWARRIEAEWENKPVLQAVAKLLSRRAWWNPLAPLPPVGGRPALHGVEPNERDVYQDLGERVGHTLVLGTTRVGKTRLEELLVAQDIRRQETVVVFDPKGDAELLKRVYAEACRAGREDQFFMFHLGYPEHSARYNAVGSFGRITEVATRTTRPLPSEGNSAAFREFAWRFVNVVAQARVALGTRPDYRQILRDVSQIEPLLIEYYEHWLSQVGPEGWREAVRQQEEDGKVPRHMQGRDPRAVALVLYAKDRSLSDPVADGLRSAFEYDKTYFDKIVASLLPLLEKLTTGKSAELIAPDYSDTSDPRPILDWREVIRTGGVVYVGLDALADTEVAAAVGNAMFADLCSVAGQIYKHGQDVGMPDRRSGMPVVNIHADEFNELIGDEFVPMLNKAGGSGFQVTAYTQTWSDVEARLGSKPKSGQVAGNFNTLIMLRVKEYATAEMLTAQLPEVRINTLMEVSGVNDSADTEASEQFTSRNEDRLSVEKTPMLTPADVLALPKGQAFALLNGGQLYKIRMPLPQPGNDPAMPEHIAEIAECMDESYNTGEDLMRPEPIPLVQEGQ